MVRLRNRDVNAAKNVKTTVPDNEYDPVRLYQRYISSLQITPKTKDTLPNGTLRSAKKSSSHEVPSTRRTPGYALETKRSKMKTPIRPKASVEIQTSRGKVRPKTPTTKRKPVASLEEYALPAEKKVSFEANEVECFFDALKETVEEVVQDISESAGSEPSPVAKKRNLGSSSEVECLSSIEHTYDQAEHQTNTQNYSEPINQSKLATVVNTVVDTLNRKIEDVLEKSQKVEATFASLCSELNNKIMFYGEEHSRHFRYICMKLEYDKIFYQHINNLIHPNDQTKSAENLAQPKKPSNPQLSASTNQSSSNQQSVDDFEVLPTCYHSQSVSTTTETAVANQQTSAWLQQTSSPGVKAQISSTKVVQTARNFSHSDSGPFQRVLSCQTTRSCPKQINEPLVCPIDSGNEEQADTGLVQSKSVDVSFVSSGSDKAQLGIKEFLDTLKVFQSNLKSSRGAAVVTNDGQFGDEKKLANNCTSNVSVMDTDDSCTELVISNGVSMLSSDDETMTPIAAVVK